MSLRHSFVFPYLLTVSLLVVSFLFPSVHLAFASETGVNHGEMSMDCENSHCEDTSEEQSCLDHCLQSATSKDANFAIAQNQIELLAVAPSRIIFEKPSNSSVRIIPQATGPPRHTEIHLTTQQLE